jgi:RNA polymerase sigma factor (sigma-70 family)
MPVIQFLSSNDPEDFRTIIREYSDDLLRIAFHFVHDWDEAQDLTQLTLIKCYRGRARYDPNRPFRAWLYRIHLNTCKGAARRAARRRRREIRLDDAPELSAVPVESGDEELIRRQIARLSARQRTAFVLIAIEGLSSAEAAYVMGCSDSTARVHLARAKETLHTELTKLGLSYGTA